MSNAVLDGLAKSLYVHTGVPSALYENDGGTVFPYFALKVISVAHDQESIALHSLTWRVVAYYFHDEYAGETEDSTDGAFDVFHKALEAFRRITLPNGVMLDGYDIESDFIDGVMQIRATYIVDYRYLHDRDYMERLDVKGDIHE